MTFKEWKSEGKQEDWREIWRMRGMSEWTKSNQFKRQVTQKRLETKYETKHYMKSMQDKVYKKEKESTFLLVLSVFDLTALAITCMCTLISPPETKIFSQLLRHTHFTAHPSIKHPNTVFELACSQDKAVCHTHTREPSSCILYLISGNEYFTNSSCKT